MDTETQQQRVREDAAFWYARLQAPDCTPQDRADFRRWLYAAPEHRGAFDAAETIGVDLLGAASLDARLRDMADWAFELGDVDPDEPPEAAAVSEHVGPASTRRWFVPAALAAGAALAAVTFFALQSTTLVRGEAFATEDARRRITLDDGSVVELDVHTNLEVAIDADARLVTLHRGRAIFDVAHDPARPFSVAAGAGEVRAIGTVFQVQREHQALTVTLAEGSVEVTRARGGAPQTTRLAPGQQLSLAHANADWQTRQVDPVAATAWSTGRLVFHDARLADAIEEINRYAETKVRLADPSLADLPVSGSFLVGDSVSIVTALAAVLPLRVSSDGRDTLLFRRGAGGFSDGTPQAAPAPPDRGS